MAEQQQQQQPPAKVLLIHSLGQILCEESPELRAAVALKLAEWDEHACAGFLGLADADRRLALRQLGQQPSAPAAAAAGTPAFYTDVVLTILGEDGRVERVYKFDRTTRPSLQKLLDNWGCAVVHDPELGYVDFASLQLRDNAVLVALRDMAPMESRVATLEGFVESTVSAFEEDATQAMLRQLQRSHDDARIVDVRVMTDVNGQKKEVDGVVIADDCAAIVEAKQVLDASAVEQLTAKLEFVRSKQLVGRAKELKAKPKLLGFVAGRIVTRDTEKVKTLLQSCQDLGYGVLASSGKSLSLGNGRIPALRVDCALRRSVCGGAGKLMRMGL